jgi:hypothetical protein
MDAQFLFLAFTDAAEYHSEDLYIDWYLKVHIPDTLKAEGWTSAQMYRLSSVQRDGQEPYWKYLVAYTVEGPEDTILPRVDAAAPSGPVSVPDRLMWKPFYRLWTYRKMEPKPFDLDSAHVFLAFTDPAPGREDEYHDWYLNTHIPEVLESLAWTDAQRYELAEPAAQRSGQDPYRGCLVWYTVDRPESEILTPVSPEPPHPAGFSYPWRPDSRVWAYTRIGERIFG